MENLFRLMLVRPAVSQDPEQPSIELEQESDYQDALRAAVATGRGRPGIEEASQRYASSGDFVGSVGDTPLGAQLDELARRLDTVEVDDELPWATVRSLITEVFGHPAADVVATDDYGSTVRRLRDSLIAIKVLQRLHRLPIEELTRQLRTAELIAAAAESI